MHDKNGQPIKAGDMVVLRGKVMSVSPDASTCNVNVQLEGKSTASVLTNADCVEVVAQTGETVQQAAERGFNEQFKKRD